MDPRTQPGGQKLWNEGEKVSYGDLNNAGVMAQRTALHLMAEIFRNATPQSGALGSSFLCSLAGGLDVSVARGLGFFYDSAETSAWLTHYKPISVEAAQTVTLDARPVVNPRADLISVGPYFQDDETTTDMVRDPATGTIAPASIDNRRHWHFQITVTKGSPAPVPLVPLCPSGHIPLCDVLVPVSDPLEIHDRRDVLHIQAEQTSSFRSLGLLLTVGAEVADVIPVSIQVYDHDGEDYSGAAGVQLLAELWNPDLTNADPAEFALDVTDGTPALGGSYATSRVTLVTNTDGTAEVSVKDIAGGSGATGLVLKVSFLSDEFTGVARMSGLISFDGV